MRRVLPLALLACIAATAGGCSTDAATVTDTPPDRRADAPSFDVEGLNGGRLPSTRFAGKPLVLNFWASWCEPCRQEMPDLQRFATGQRAVAVAGIAVNDAPADSRAFAREAGVTFPLGIDRRAAVAADFGVTALPVTVIIDAQGRIVSTVRGPVDEADLARARALG